MKLDPAFLATLPCVGIALLPAIILMTSAPEPTVHHSQTETCCLDLVDASIPFQPTKTK